MKRQKAKSVKLGKNDLICSKCNTILEVDDALITERYLQCSNCEIIISNPFLHSGKFVSCDFCSKDSEIPKEMENDLVLNCPTCGKDIYNRHSEKYNVVICPECHIESHVPETLFKARYLNCSNCGYALLENPYHQEAGNNKVLNDKTHHGPYREKDLSEEYNSETVGMKNYGWISFIVLGIIIILVIGYISERNTRSINVETNGLIIPTLKWYEMGTLHKAEIYDWKRANDKNKLATCADFISIYRPNYSEQELKFAATELQACIDDAIIGHNDFDGESVAALATLCMTGLGYIN